MFPAWCHKSPRWELISPGARQGVVAATGGGQERAETWRPSEPEMWGCLGSSGHSLEMGPGCGAECQPPQRWVLRAVMPMFHIFLSWGGRGGAESEDSLRMSQGWPPLHGMACRGKQKLWAQLYPCPCPAMTPMLSLLASPSFSQVVVRSLVNLPWEKLLLCPTVCPQSCRSRTFSALKSGHRVMCVHHPVQCMSTLHLSLPLLLLSGRRAGAHVSHATCKSTDIIRAVVEGITRASACEARVPCLGRWPGAPARRGVHLVLILTIPLGMGWLLGWGTPHCSGGAG